ncbi:mulitfunctional nucleoside diphosphate kinase/apyrimidinic endonuclease/3'-phosphodiesterase [Halorubrum californiense DSM 19288]|uniref:Nucleoside diphosphate kinase n=1 Tax=Halorubrum californiense DSM 19288 TaxID=1227465 RepID=M0DZY1_9EURY|nr:MULTISPECIES: nucleoside-diphosphate kinase [Halorubrum]ELZ39654.1 mulitfunctional nucleoside diphosphate kinase/apyrimidinic endonuclease/3'-phosphodiesterase [Halorubrum californiense DSM 19288]TKX67935.1 nucleoside-diphosphate kinase [Halorubrum sp. GN11GM_10-3_MGM]
MSHHDERTFVMVKPDGVQRGLIGEIVSRFEDRGLKLVAGKFVQLDEELAKSHYGEHEDKPFFDGLVEFITSGPVFAMVWEGADATRQVRAMVGETDPTESPPGTIRGDFGLDLGHNVIHASDHEDEGANEREIDLFFDDDELVDYDLDTSAWVYEEEDH